MTKFDPHPPLFQHRVGNFFDPPPSSLDPHLQKISTPTSILTMRSLGRRDGRIYGGKMNGLGNGMRDGWRGESISYSRFVYERECNRLRHSTISCGLSPRCTKFVYLRAMRRLRFAFGGGAPFNFAQRKQFRFIGLDLGGLQPGHGPPIIENLPCIYHFFTTLPPIFWFAHPIFLASLRQC